MDCVAIMKPIAVKANWDTRLEMRLKSPLMRSTGALSALFHEGAVVCEGDSDRTLYQEINDRLSAFDHRRSAEALFLNAHSKQATAKLAGPLREMGIPAAVVVDFDILKPSDDFKNLLPGVAHHCGQSSSVLRFHAAWRCG